MCLVKSYFLSTRNLLIPESNFPIIYINADDFEREGK